MRFGGGIRACCIFKLSQNVRFRRASRSRRGLWRNTKRKVFHGKKPFSICHSHFSFVIAGIHHARNQRRWHYNGGAPFRKADLSASCGGAQVPNLNGASKQHAQAASKTTRRNGATKRHAETFLDQSQMKNGKW